MDLVQAISEILGFNYTVRLVRGRLLLKMTKEAQVEDGKYGSFDKATQTWNGMIGELQSQKVHSICALTVHR